MLGNHVLATTMSGMPILFVGGRGLSPPSGRLANILHRMSSKYGNNVYAHGVLFGSTLMMGLVMHVMSSYYGGVSRCVTKSHAAWIDGEDSGHASLTGGYDANDDDDSISSSSTTTTQSTATSANFDPWGNCGASGPVGFISLLTGLLFWFDVILALVLYIKREELLSGEGYGVVGSGGSNQYEEIRGVDDDDGSSNLRDGGGGFAGDFPSMSAAAGMRTMHV